VEQGLVSRFGLVDPDLRGASSRYAVSADWRWQVEGSRSALELHVVSHDLELLSNFTYNLDDPSDDTRVDGDQFLQTDDRVFAGARYEYEGPRIGWGAEARYDRIDNGLAGARGGVPDETVRSDSIDQLLGGAWVEARLRPADWLRARIGLRGDLWSADVTSDLDVNSGSETDALVSPKLALAFGPWDRTEAYLNLGLGYHSNDARGATIHVDPRTGDPVEPVDPLVRARGADVGVRTTVLERLHSSLSVFVLEIDSELVFVGDAGGTEASRPGRRTGVELVNHWRPVDWIGVDLDVTLSDAEFTDDDPAGHEIPGAIDTTAAAGVSVERGRFFGGVRWRYFGARPLIEDGSVESSSSSLVNAQVGWNFAHGFTVAIEAFNVLDREENDIEYFYASRLAGEPLEGVEDIHFHPAEPRAVRVVGRYRF
jgi:outer membrane receptor protein involved in Fe transport